MSIIDTLVTDRTASDVAAGNDKGTYNASDLNRVGQAVSYIADLLTGYGYSVQVSPKTDWAIGDIPYPAQLQQYLSDVAALRAVLELLPTTPEVPADMEGLTVQEANDIEKILVDIDALLSIMATTFIPCGEALCGEDNL